MKVVTGGERGAVYGGRFTGHVELEMLHATPPDVDAGVDGPDTAFVHFHDGAVTFWHSHPGGQQLFVVSGDARVGTEADGEVAVPTGTLVVCPPIIKQGPIVQVKNYQGQITVDDDTDSQIAYEGPLAVLVDRFSASASEIVAGALQNYGRAIVIGDSSTHGKGSVQQVVEMRQISPLRNAVDPKTGAPLKTGAAKFTIQKYYLPSGDSTQQKGVVPDVVLPSIDDYIPGLGEASLPHVLAWDKIATSYFDGAPLDPKILTPLRQASLERQNKLEEFTYLRKRVDWFKARQEQKLISLNLEERKQQKASDDAFQKAMRLERDRVAQSDYAFSEVRLSPPPPPRIKAPLKDEEKTDADLDSTADENESYPKADVHLRESLRIISDAVGLAQNRELWVSARPPLTARSKG